MKRFFAVMLAVVMLSASVAFAQESQTEQSYEAQFYAMILSMNDDASILVQDVQTQTQYEVLFDEKSQIVSDGPLYEGNFIEIQYDGKATRSNPAQITVGCLTRFSVSGLVSEVSSQDNTLLVDDKQGSQVLVRLPDALKAGDYAQRYVIVCYDGIMTMSLPGQVNAMTIDSFYAMDGVVTEKDDETLMMDVEGTPWQVNFDEKTRGQNAANVGDTVRVLYDGKELRSNPGQITAQVIEVLGESYSVEGRVLSQENDSWVIETDDGQVQINLIDATVDESNAKVGDTVRVTYDGAMTRSLPPQIGALIITGVK